MNKTQIIFSHVFCFHFKIGPRPIKDTSIQFSFVFRGAWQKATIFQKEWFCSCLMTPRCSHVHMLQALLDQTVFTSAFSLSYGQRRFPLCQSFGGLMMSVPLSFNGFHSQCVAKEIFDQKTHWESQICGVL